MALLRSADLSATVLKYFQRTLSYYCQRRGSRHVPLVSRSSCRPLYLLRFGRGRPLYHLHRRVATEKLWFSSLPDSSHTHAQQKAPTCSGCGSVLQSEDREGQGYIPREKLLLREEEDGADEAGESSVVVPPQPTCRRCFSLKHYNTALNVTLGADDYLRHLSHLRDKRALVLLVVDVIDFPGSLFPRLHSLISDHSRVLIVANKIDLLPQSVDRSFWKRLEEMILAEGRASSLEGCPVMGVAFTSVKTGEGLDKLSTSVLEGWGNRGDVYLLGCTNVGKSSLFNYLLENLCELDGSHGSGKSGPVPLATISHWPGTTLGLLSFPLMSVGKRRRLLAQQMRSTGEMEVQEQGLAPLAQFSVERARPEGEPVKERFWLHDTPGAINQAQLINLLTTKELNLALPKKPLKPRTFILRPGQCLMLGGLARLDYIDGPVSAYFTVFAASYLPVHVTIVDKADSVWTKNLGQPLLKIPCGDSERLDRFPVLQPQLVSVTGCGWAASVADVILSSAGWVAVTVGRDKELSLVAHTPGGLGVHCRHPSLCQDAVTRRGKRSRKDRASFIGK